MKCLLIAIYELKAEEVVIIGHYGCGMAKQNTEDLLHRKTAELLNKHNIPLNNQE